MQLHGYRARSGDDRAKVPEIRCGLCLFGRFRPGSLASVASQKCFLATVLLVGIVGGASLAFEKSDIPTPKKTEEKTAAGGKATLTKAASVGSPIAAGLMTQLEQEIRSGLAKREIESNFSQWVRYINDKLNATAGTYTGSEITGNCRLRWYDSMMRHPLTAAGEAEKFTRELHEALQGDHEGLDRALRIARDKMDCGTRKAQSFVAVTSPQQALEAVKEALVGAQVGYAKALAPLSKSELGELTRYLYPILCGTCRQGHTIDDRGTGRRLCDLLEKIDRRGFFDAADALVPLTSPELLKQLAKLPEEGDIQVEGVLGRVVAQIPTPAGTIIIGGKGKNVYDLDRMTGVAAVIDLGGDDEYREGTCSFERPVLLVIDLGGNDRYIGSKPGIQGGAVLGVSMLLDFGDGDDVYEAQDVAQGSALGGVGILIDYGGNDRYVGVRRVQGSAMGGLGILIDRKGRDDYHAAMWSQGFGHPLGFGVLDDLEGDDHYYAGGLYRDSYPETPGYEGWSQGVGAGIRQVANGGIGVILDGSGDDVYEFDYISHGGGYWLGMGFAGLWRQRSPPGRDAQRLRRRPPHASHVPAIRLRFRVPLRPRILL